MNGKKAKMLRSLAQTITIGKPYASYVIEPNGLKKRPSLEIEKGCFRQVYKEAKRDYLAQLKVSSRG